MTLLGCFTSRTSSGKKSPSEFFLDQYAYLLHRSFSYDIENSSFKYRIQEYIDSYKEYNQVLEEEINPFKHGIPLESRNEPKILQPYLFSGEYDRVIIMVVRRDRDLADNRVDRVHFILGEVGSGKWEFTKKKGYVRSFGYEGGHPSLSDTEISLRVLRTLIDQGFMPVNKLRVNDKFFKNDRW